MTGDNPEAMTLDTFEELLDTYGRLESWPERQRSSGAAFAEQSPAARHMLTQLHTLESVLEDLPVLEPTAALRRAVAKVPVRAPRAIKPAFDLRFLWRPLVTVGLFAVMGVSLGLVATEPEGRQTASAYDEEWEDGLALTQLAFASEWVGDEDDE